MNSVHDMGGMHGLGPVAPEADEPVFHEPWEARAFALNVATRALGHWTLDASRHARERIPGADYLRMSYYEKWFAGLVTLLTEAGLATDEEIARGVAGAGAPNAPTPITAQAFAESRRRVRSTRRAIDAQPRFAIGDAVRARNLNPVGHTRLPRYVRGRLGTVALRHGAHVFADTYAHGLGEQPQHLYQVRFEAAELWGEPPAGRSAVHLDLWEPYLEPA